ncbi:unnamed protein product, partial [Coregonus sp. 'balchen']
MSRSMSAEVNFWLDRMCWSLDCSCFRVDFRYKNTLDSCQYYNTYSCYSGNCGGSTREVRLQIDSSTNGRSWGNAWFETETVMSPVIDLLKCVYRALALRYGYTSTPGVYPFELVVEDFPNQHITMSYTDGCWKKSTCSHLTNNRLLSLVVESDPDNNTTSPINLLVVENNHKIPHNHNQSSEYHFHPLVVDSNHHHPPTRFSQTMEFHHHSRKHISLHYSPQQTPSACSSANFCNEGVYLTRFVQPTPRNGEHLHAEVNKELEIRVNAQATFSTPQLQWKWRSALSLEFMRTISVSACDLQRLSNSTHVIGVIPLNACGTQIQMQCGRDCSNLLTPSRETFPVYISCSVILCEAGNLNTRCAQGCVISTSPQSAGHHYCKREAPMLTAMHPICQGPLRLQKTSESLVTNMNMNMVFIAGCLLTAVAMLCGMILYKAKATWVKYQPIGNLYRSFPAGTELDGVVTADWCGEIKIWAAGALLTSCAALSIRAVRMVERGMETRSEMEESGGLSRSAAEEDMGHSSRHRDTMESTITWELSVNKAIN